MTPLPPELKNIVAETERLLTAIRQLKAKKRRTVSDLRKIAELKTEISALCPPGRYAWVDGKPVVDILKKLDKIEKEHEMIKKDQYLRHVSEIDAPIGMTPHDAARHSPGPSLPRAFEEVRDREQCVYPKSEEYIFCRGAAIGVDEDGQAFHFSPELDHRFVGFLLADVGNRADVQTRGSVVLRIEGATDSDRGKAVYCAGVNSFTLCKGKGAAEIGKIRYVQDGKAAVAFRRQGDERPLNLDIQ